MDIQKEIEISGHQPAVFIPDTELGELLEAMVERKKIKNLSIDGLYLLQSGPCAWNPAGAGQKKRRLSEK